MNGSSLTRCSVVLAALLIAGGAHLSNAQGPATPAPGPNASINPNKLETEVVTILNNVAIPNTITRKQGRFYLLLINKARGAQPSLAFDSPTAAAAQIPILGAALNLPRLAGAQKLASLFNAPPGTYFLKSQATGKVLLTINIEN